MASDCLVVPHRNVKKKKGKMTGVSVYKSGCRPALFRWGIYGTG